MARWGTSGHLQQHTSHHWACVQGLLLSELAGNQGLTPAAQAALGRVRGSWAAAQPQGPDTGPDNRAEDAGDVAVGGGAGASATSGMSPPSRPWQCSGSGVPAGPARQLEQDRRTWNSPLLCAPALLMLAAALVHALAGQPGLRNPQAAPQTGSCWLAGGKALYLGGLHWLPAMSAARAVACGGGMGGGSAGCAIHKAALAGLTQGGS